jgi:SAM-dependent methyltransferase
MINYLFSRVQRPERGWDPVPAPYAAAYAEQQWGADTRAVVDDLAERIGDLGGRRVLDLGGGPGHYTAEFARRGARVTWHDVSDAYRRLAHERLGSLAEDVEWSLGYLEEAARFGPVFDLVFNRICWYYCMSDRHFARLVHGLVKPGGWAYIVTPYLESPTKRARLLHRARGRLNEHLGIKIGHPFPSLRLFRRVWRGLETRRFELEPNERNVTVLFQR